MQKPCTFNEVANLTKGVFLHRNQATQKIEQLCTDSRTITKAANSCFFALVGEKRDGHQHIKEAYQKGIRYFVVSRKNESYTSLVGAGIILVDNVLNALQAIGKKQRINCQIPVIGITGSNGKTIVKEWLYQLLKQEKKVVRSPKSFNSQIGVPLSLWLCEPEHELGIFEAGISQPGEMAVLADLIQPNIGIITNIGGAHSENFSSNASKTKEKLRLFENCETIIYGADNALIEEEIKKNPLFKKVATFSWSKTSKATLSQVAVQKKISTSVIQGVYENKTIAITIPFYDDASIENAITCWCYLLHTKHSNHWIQAKMLELEPVALRLEMANGANNCSLIKDYYNSDLNSLAIALDFFAQQQQHQKKIVILSDIQQSGLPSKELYQKVNSLLQEKGTTEFIGVGPTLLNNQAEFSLPSQFFPSTEQLISALKTTAITDATILLKGARAFHFENINHALQHKTHRTILEINLSAVQHNLNFFKSNLSSTTKIMVMVKALSYGSGTFEIANLLQFNKVNYLGVAYADEGVALRQAGISLPIMVMNPEEQAFEMIIENKLEPEIYNFNNLQLFNQFASTHNQKNYPIHLKFDTGMNRLGFNKKDLTQLKQTLAINNCILVKSVFSHLATSDEPSMKKHTLHQIEEFRSIKQFFSTEFKQAEPPLFHILNSAGALAFPEAQFDMTRIGIGLYGIAPFKSYEKQLEQVSELKTRISQIKSVEKGEAVGYSRAFIAEQKTTVAIVPIGYADGFRRSLGNGNGKMFVNGNKVPVIGNVCMDMCMLDVTGISANEGDEVIVFGKDLPVSELAESMGTIPYEVLTSISPRVKRIYFQD